MKFPRVDSQSEASGHPINGFTLRANTHARHLWEAAQQQEAGEEEDRKSYGSKSIAIAILRNTLTHTTIEMSDER